MPSYSASVIEYLTDGPVKLLRVWFNWVHEMVKNWGEIMSRVVTLSQQ